MTANPNRLLLIDRFDEDSDAVVNYLRQQGYEVVHTDQTDEALAQAKQGGHDIVLCDPKIATRGVQHFLNDLKDLVYYTPVIVMTDTNEVSEVTEALRAGAVDYLLKPVADMDMLGHAVTRSLDFYQLERENHAYRKQLEQTNLELKHNLALLEQDQKAGRQVQFKMLPQSPMQMGEFHFRHRIYASLYLSGDFVDYFSVGAEHAVFFIADVSGHGASSAFITVLLKNLFARKRSDYTHHGDPAILSPIEMLQLSNQMILETDVGKHLTMCLGVLHLPSGKLRYSNAGHLPQPVLSAAGQGEFLAGEGMPVGLFDEPEFSEQVLALPEQCVLTLFSDGILEILPAEGLKAKEAFLQGHLGQPNLTVEAVAESLGLQEVQEFPDDIAVLLIARGYH